MEPPVDAAGGTYPAVTPATRTIVELSSFLAIPAHKIIKSVACLVDSTVVLVLVRGDHELNEAKLKQAHHASIVEMLPGHNFAQAMNSVPGFIGPVGLQGIKIVADYSIMGMSDVISGANEQDHHYLHTEPGRDFQADYYDLRNIVEGDHCPRCGAEIQFTKGIELGHVFKLGTNYRGKKSFGTHRGMQMASSSPAT